ncbi:MAG: hypothetical protein ABII01_04625 [Candidatus Woesearchaeota archaeon]
MAERTNEVKHRLEGDYITAIDGAVLKHKDYFNLKDLYVLMHEWLVQYGWCTRADEDFPEKFFLQKEAQQSGKELWIWWRLEKFPDGVYNTYYKYQLDIDVHVILLKDVEVVRNGVKFKAHHGEPEIKLNARVVVDYQNKWKNHWLLGSFYEVFRNRVFKVPFSMHRRELYREIYRFQEHMKTYFKLMTYLPEEEGEQWQINEDYE